MQKCLTKACISDVITAAQIQAFQVRYAGHDISKTSLQTENLNPPDTTFGQATEERWVRATEMNFCFNTPPYCASISSIAPADTYLSSSPLISYIQVAKDHDEQLRKQGMDVGLAANRSFTVDFSHF